MTWVARIDAITVSQDGTTLDTAITVYDDVTPSRFIEGGASFAVSSTQAEARTAIETAGAALRARLQARTSGEATRLSRGQQFVGTILTLP